jgi:DNA-binding NtrC family response regulator
MEACGPAGSVFLDEIGELEPGIQVKLLRLLQGRVFQRIGETRERRFEGKVIAATHRDLAGEMEAGRFRPDLYYRLCADLVRTPSLRDQLAGAPEELGNLVALLARRIAGEEEAEALTSEVLAWVERELGADYPWPGNVRELEQCVRNVLVRGSYAPARAAEGARAPASEGAAELAARIADGELTAEDLLRHYCTVVYARVGSYEETARRLGIDRRTVKSRLDPALLERLRARDGARGVG